MKVVHILPDFSISQAGLFYAVKGLAQFSAFETEVWSWKFDSCDVSVKKIGLQCLVWNIFMERSSMVAFHFHGCWSLNLFAGVLVARVLKKPIYFHPHGMLSPWALSQRRIKKRVAFMLFQGWVMCLADRIVCNSWIEQREISSLRGSSARKIVCIPNGIDPPRVQRVPWTRNKTLGFLSRLHEKKGIVELISAFSDSQLKGWQLAIGGYGHSVFVHKCEALAKFSNKKIYFLGMVDDHMKDQFFTEIDYLVLPSLSENFGLVVAESLARGVPVLTTRHTPWVNESNIGVMEIHTDPQKLSIELSCIAIINAEKYAAMSSEARRYAEKFYWNNIECKYIDEYSKFLGYSPR